MSPDSLDAKDRFTGRVCEYVRFRPSYPPEVIAFVKKNVAPGSVVADIGSGTGIFTRLLLEAGFTVYAVEPNSAMRLAAETLLGGKPGFISVNGDGERTTLPDESFNAITAAQAFHWFPTPAAVTEFGRILRPKGRTFLIWNDRKTECDTFHQEYENLLLRYGTDYALVNHRNITEEILRGLFSGWSCESFRIENHQDLTLDALLGRLDSSSYCPPPGHPNHAPLMAAAESLFHREAGKGLVRMRYECVVYHLKRIR